MQKEGALSAEDKTAYGYSFRFGAYSFSLKFGTITCHETGTEMSPGTSAFKDYLPLLLEDQLKGPGLGVVFHGIRLASTSYAYQVGQIRKVLGQLTGSADVVRHAIPRGEPVEVGAAEEPKTRYRSNFTDIKRVQADAKDSLTQEEAREQNSLVALAEARLDDVMADLIEIAPDVLTDFFAQTDGGHRLPVFVMDEETFGRPSWPLPVVEDVCSAPDRGRMSLVQQRVAEGARLYNGHIYRLVEARPGAWRLGKTRYVDILDDCDILRARIFAEWGAVCAQPAEERQAVLRQSPWVAEWLERVRAIKAGHFGGYCAGMAVNMPIFFALHGELYLLLGHGSLDKAAGGGKLHVCPAGMMEFHRNTLLKEVRFETVRTIITRELYEEVFHSQVLVEAHVHEHLEGIFRLPQAGPGGMHSDAGGGGFPFLESLFTLAEAHMGRMGPENTPLRLSRHVRSLPEDTTRTYQIVDAFRLRPEIVIPICLDYQPELFLGWEYLHVTPDMLKIGGAEDLDAYVAEHKGRWAEPGLAGMYLAARDYLADDG